MDDQDAHLHAYRLAPDAAVMAPFRVGDYVEFSGVKLPNGEIACYSVVANVDIRTASGSKPSYIRMEDALVGVIDTDTNVEFSQSKVNSSIHSSLVTKV